jgi:2-hydroxychromene-2-carboxylate isomerase
VQGADTIRDSAEAAGVFGVPSLIVEGELFWGRKHLAEIREKLAPFARTSPARVAPPC